MNTMMNTTITPPPSASVSPPRKPAKDAETDISVIKRIITRINELGIRMGVHHDRLVLEGKLSRLTDSERGDIKRLKDRIVAYLSEPREHVAIMCKHRHPDGRACSGVVTVQRETGKVAWCEACYPADVDMPTPSRQVLEAKQCHACERTDWWITKQGVAVCRTCHPPAHESLEHLGEEPAPFGCKTPRHNAKDIVANAPHVVLPLYAPRQTRSYQQPAMWVAGDLEHLITDEPHFWSETVRIRGKDFSRLTVDILMRFKKQVAKAEAACNGGKLSLEAFTRIVQAFCPVYEFAVRVGMIPDPVHGARKSEGMQ